MLFSALILVLIAVAELTFGVALLTAVTYPLRKSKWPINSKQWIFSVLGGLLASPAIAPAGTLAVFPLPLGVLLAFVRTSTDAYFKHGGLSFHRCS